MPLEQTKRRMNPQTVPRGFLRSYVLSLLSRNPETGYSVMRIIDEKTDGAWRPGPGTVYPLLRSMVKEGLVKAMKPEDDTQGYTITPEGKKELERFQEHLGSAGRNERAMINLMFDFMTPTLFSSIVVKRSRTFGELFAEKIAEVPQPERDAILREMQVVTENQLALVKSLLERKSRAGSRA